MTAMEHTKPAEAQTVLEKLTLLKRLVGTHHQQGLKDMRDLIDEIKAAMSEAPTPEPVEAPAPVTRTFDVLLKEAVYYTIKVTIEPGEADDLEEGATIEEHVEALAEQMWVDSEDPSNDFCGDGQGVTTVSVTEVKP